MESQKTAQILLVEDNPADVLLMREAFTSSTIVDQINVVVDGEEALDYLKKKNQFTDAKTPDLILLDLNLPKIDGREVLIEVNKDSKLRRIPVIVLSSSKDENDILESYDNSANCYIVKPIELEKFVTIVETIESFWFGFAALPH
jgi:chemotaxis family two-component system response regulator Rcp1